MTIAKNSNFSHLKWSSINFNDNKQEASNRMKLASACEDSNTISVWNARDGKLYQELADPSNDKNSRITGQ